MVVRGKGGVWDGKITCEAGVYGEDTGDANVGTVFFCGEFQS